MKVDIIRKFKWYIVGFILVVIMLSVVLSFCTWDNLSIQALKAKSNIGGYSVVKLNEHLTLVDDKDNNGKADIGDIVNFGRYYQEADDITNKAPLRWIIVHKEGTTLTLLVERVVAFGSFWGTTFYYNSGNSREQGIPNNGTYYQNYSQSTVRAWLNSQQRTDVESDNVNAVFSNTDTNPMFRGFMQEALNMEEQAYLLPKTISGMYGSIRDAKNDAVNSTSCESYAPVTDKVWLPSYSEVYGNSTIGWNGKSDGSPNEQFSYFSDNQKTKATTTAFARSSASNYTWKGATGAGNYQSVTTAEANVWWWLRSPYPLYYPDVLMVGTDGMHSLYYTCVSYGGVRPAVCVQL